MKLTLSLLFTWSIACYAQEILKNDQISIQKTNMQTGINTGTAKKITIATSTINFESSIAKEAPLKQYDSTFNMPYTYSDKSFKQLIGQEILVLPNWYNKKIDGYDKLYTDTSENASTYKESHRFYTDYNEINGKLFLIIDYIKTKERRLHSEREFLKLKRIDNSDTIYWDCSLHTEYSVKNMIVIGFYAKAKNELMAHTYIFDTLFYEQTNLIKDKTIIHKDDYWQPVDLVYDDTNFYFVFKLRNSHSEEVAMQYDIDGVNLIDDYIVKTK